MAAILVNGHALCKPYWVVAKRLLGHIRPVPVAFFDVLSLPQNLKIVLNVKATDCISKNWNDVVYLVSNTSYPG